MSATLASEEARRQRAEGKAADLTARLAAAARAKVDAELLISDLKTRVWDEQARAELLEAMSRPAVVRYNQRQKALDRCAFVC